MTTTEAEPDVQWRGQWISTGEDGPAAPLLRRDLTAGPDVRSAQLHVAGLGLHRTTLDGAPVTDARLESGLSHYGARVLYSSYSVELGPGDHTIGVELGRGFYAMTTVNVWRWEQAPWRDLRKALVQLELLDADGHVVDVVTSDAHWRWTSGPTRFDSYYEGETFDARMDPVGWDSPGFTADGWAPVELVDPPTGRLVPQRHEPVRVVQTHEMSWLGGGDSGRPLVADVGRNLAGWVQVDVSGLPAGTTLGLQHGERLRPDGSVEAESVHVASERFNRSEVVTGAEPLRWEPRFSYTGFRYVQVDGVADPTGVGLRARHAHNDVREVSTFRCSDEVLSWIDSAMRLTVRNNLHHVPTDTPVYEKNGWTGDAQVAAEAMLAQFDLSRLFTKWLDDMADSQDAKGLIPVIVPSPGWGYRELAPAPEWTTLYPYLLDRVVDTYDRPDLAERHLGPVLAYLDHELGRITSDGLTSGVLGDYLAPGSHGTPPDDDLRMAASCYLHRALVLTADLVERTGWRDDSGTDHATRLRDAAASLATAVHRELFDAEQGLYTSDREPRYRQSTNILPVALGLTPPDEVGRVVDRLARDLTERGDHHDAGCLGLSELFGVLTRHGHADLAVRVASQVTPPSWGAWMESGEQTLREMWGTESRSLNHYFMGAMARWLYDSVAGVRRLAPGWREFAVEPAVVESLTHASYFYDGPQGRLGAAWERQERTLWVEVVVPERTRVWVRLPGREPESSGPGTWHFTVELPTG
ncbi:alpha-L-rhamnosidase [Desertihabitans aurantiacus]|uniref:alpha-L-rhamnosidase n=1 Tax=Desertihabitans aurantiacus TaxID=2282477 RepID=UPI000DF7942D|nr:alpha-L-rhamnosidase [Desertihabitans aurantiacus]